MKWDVLMKPAIAKKFPKIIALITMIMFSFGPAGFTAPLPNGWTWQAGNGSIVINGKVMDISQLSDKAIIDWISYCIAHGYTVNYIQPSGNSICLNRLLNSSVS